MSSIFSLVRQYSVLLRPAWISHVHHFCFCCMPRSQTPEKSLRPTISVAAMLPSGVKIPSALPDINLFGAQSLQLSLTACNFSCLRLAYCITTICPRLDTKCAGSALPRQHLQLLAEWHFRGALKTSSFQNRITR